MCYLKYKIKIKKKNILVLENKYEIHGMKLDCFAAVESKSFLEDFKVFIFVFI